MGQAHLELQDFITRHVQQIDSLSTRLNTAYYAAQVSGKKEDFQNIEQLRLQLNELYMNKADFEFLQKTKESAAVNDARQQRQLEKLYNAFIISQMDSDLLKKSISMRTSLMERYNNYRGSIDGKPAAMTEIYRIMTQEHDVELRQKAWRAAKEVGPVIIEDFLKWVKMQNQLARQIGYDNFHTYAINIHEQSVDDLDAIFNELACETATPFAELKGELDAILAATFKIEPNDLRPWHYHDPFFQRTPLVYEIDLDPYYADNDVARLSINYFAGVGLRVDDIMARSDLYEKPGKFPHAFAIDIDRHGDVRILQNIANNERWMETTLHELGHAVYFKYHDPNEPYLLREPAHMFTTEAAAMFFGRLSRNAVWMQTMLGLSDAQRSRLETVTDKYLRFQQILFARWAMVMYYFEKSVYADPDQDLNTLWWDLVETYQFVNRPEGNPDAGWLSKLHFITAPCYYHNYMLGELLVSQWYHYIRRHVLQMADATQASYAGDTRIGDYFKDHVFGPGARYHWNDMIRRSTGETLNISYFLKQFVT